MLRTRVEEHLRVNTQASLADRHPLKSVAQVVNAFSGSFGAHSLTEIDFHAVMAVITSKTVISVTEALQKDHRNLVGDFIRSLCNESLRGSHTRRAELLHGLIQLAIQPPLTLSSEDKSLLLEWIVALDSNCSSLELRQFIFSVGLLSECLLNPSHLCRSLEMHQRF